ncbi:hypothetical protein GGR57DRAFT_511939 [Xylariaceae sp. FL1272]|nr:hypothetical protein GGR57DRAFT_511939 [Xylariaceae sp. FL1272]
MKILVIGAIGTQGGGVVQHCLAAGHVPYAMTRHPSSAPAQKLVHHNPGVRLVKGDLDAPDSITQAAKGMDALFFIILPTGLETEARQTQNVLAAVKTPGSSITMLIYSGAAGTGIEGIGALASGQMLDASTRLEMVDGTDVGLVIAAALTTPDKFAGRVVDLATESLTATQVADSLSRAIGRPVTAQHMDDFDLCQQLGNPALVAHQTLLNELGSYFGGTLPDCSQFGLTGIDDFFGENMSSRQVVTEEESSRLSRDECQTHGRTVRAMLVSSWDVVADNMTDSGSCRLLRRTMQQVGSHNFPISPARIEQLP